MIDKIRETLELTCYITGFAIGGSIFAGLLALKLRARLEPWAAVALGGLAGALGTGFTFFVAITVSTLIDMIVYALY